MPPEPCNNTSNHVSFDHTANKSAPASPHRTQHKSTASNHSTKPRPHKLNLEEINSSAMPADSDTANRPPFLDPAQNARSKSITVAEGSFTNGVLNQLPAPSERTKLAFQVGVSEDRGPRRTMEDAHSFVVDFGGVRGQGYFAIFDGHAGKHAAEWCGQHFHEYLLGAMANAPESPVPDILNQTFHNVDKELSKMAADGQTHSGCTAVTTFLRVEDANTGKPSLSDKALTSLAPGAVDGEKPVNATKALAEKAQKEQKETEKAGGHEKEELETVEPKRSGVKRVLYTANVGDARAVLCRGGRAIRLTYDHKGSDRNEAKRIQDAGGFVMNNRVNGVLAVTRSLGDSSMKDFVVGSPYTTETELGDNDEFMIIACDGLWDIVDDQGAVDLVRNTTDAQDASQKLMEHALAQFSSDNVSVLVVRFSHGR